MIACINGLIAVPALATFGLGVFTILTLRSRLAQERSLRREISDDAIRAIYKTGLAATFEWPARQDSEPDVAESVEHC